MWEYTDKVKQYYLNPVNVGDVENPDGVGEVGNIKCGDAMRLTFKLDENKKISEMKFKTFGCGSAIASSSVLTELCIGKSIEEIEKITNQEIADALGGLPKEKMHCSVMGQEALEEAIAYYKNGGKTPKKKELDSRIVCSCFSVTEKEIEDAIRHNKLTTVDEVTNYTKAGGGCGGCIGEIEKILERVNSTDLSEVKSFEEMTTVEKIDRIREVIDTEISPLLEKDGGGCTLKDLNGTTVIVSFVGACHGCSYSSSTQTNVVEKILKEKVSETLTVEVG